MTPAQKRDCALITAANYENAAVRAQYPHQRQDALHQRDEWLERAVEHDRKASL